MGKNAIPNPMDAMEISQFAANWAAVLYPLVSGAAGAFIFEELKKKFFCQKIDLKQYLSKTTPFRSIAILVKDFAHSWAKSTRLTRQPFLPRHVRPPLRAAPEHDLTACRDALCISPPALRDPPACASWAGSARLHPFSIWLSLNLIHGRTSQKSEPKWA